MAIEWKGRPIPPENLKSVADLAYRLNKLLVERKLWTRDSQGRFGAGIRIDHLIFPPSPPILKPVNCNAYLGDNCLYCTPMEDAHHRHNMLTLKRKRWVKRSKRWAYEVAQVRLGVSFNEVRKLHEH